MFFDSHSHMDDKRFDGDREEILRAMSGAGVSGIINVGSDMPSSYRSAELARTYNFIYAAAGVHPHEVKDMKPSDMDELRALLKRPRVVALGEIGLDYYYDHSPRDAQREWFAAQMRLAAELDKPIIVHCRDAYGDTLDILKKVGGKTVRGVMHCYSGSLETAREVLKLGMYISIAGPVTYKNNQKTAEVVMYTPLERLLIETDSPYLTPAPHRGERNDSRYVRHVAAAIAQMRSMPVERVAEITARNTRELFAIEGVA